MIFANKNGRHKRASKNPQFAFSLNCGVRFLGFFLLGMVCSRCLKSDFAARLGILLPSFLSQICSSAVPVPTGLAALSNILITALMLVSPVAVTYLLGLRDYEFFSLSRFWNLLFCMLHGVLFERFIVLWTDHIPNLYGHAVEGFISILMLLVMLLLQMLLHVQLLQANRVAAAGVSLPCLNKSRFRYPHVDSMSEKSNWQKRLLRYVTSLLRTVLSSFVMEVLVLLLCYGLRKMMQT